MPPSIYLQLKNSIFKLVRFRRENNKIWITVAERGVMYTGELISP